MSTAAKHTPTPWHIDKKANLGQMINIWSAPRAYYSKIKPFLIASVRVSKTYEGEGERNAALFEAAPYLLECLKGFDALWSKDGLNPDSKSADGNIYISENFAALWRNARAAIAKAEAV